MKTLNPPPGADVKVKESEVRVGANKARDERVSAKEIRECLSRSGYLMESRLVRRLTDEGYFVETNQAIRDPRTGKSREIDLIAENHDWIREHKGTAVKTTFVIEAVNNRYPFVLLTERPGTPHADFESYIKFIYTPERAVSFLEEYSLYDAKQADWTNLYSQYCMLTRKNGHADLMASHPDDLYGSVLKMAEYVELEMESWASFEEREPYWRMFFWQPMLVLSGRLLTATLNKRGAIRIAGSDFGRLEFNWHAGDQPRTTVIEVVTEKFLTRRLAAVRATDRKLEIALHEFHVQVGV